jgi:RHS repeat-associated protein
MKCITTRVSFASFEKQALIHLRKSVCIVLILALLNTSTPAAPQTIVSFAKKTSTDFAFWFQASTWRQVALRLIQGKDSNAKEQEKQRDRDAKVARIQIFPGDLTVDLNEQIRFAAVAYDQDNEPVGGVKIKWSGRNAGNGRRVRVTPDGEFEATASGSFNIMAEGVVEGATATVVVRPGVRSDPNLPPTGIRQVSTRDLPPAVAIKTDKSPESVAQRSTKNAGNAKPRKSLLRGHTHRSQPSPVVSPSSAVPPSNIGWDDENYWSADDPENRVGNPPGSPIDEGAGSGNFQIAAPVLGLPGRGIDISLGLAYNSRLWNKAVSQTSSQIGFDNDRGWPAPGWSLGFGKILTLGVNNGAIILEADGTRHPSIGTITQFSWGTSFAGHTVDGSFIDYSYTTGTSGALTSAQAKLANGTVITYGAPGPGAVYPTKIRDANGNYITITYVNNAGPRIQTIVDTLNRPINFHYDTSNFLTAITAPGLNGGTRTLMRLNYRQITLNYSFSGLTPVVPAPSPWVVNAIYYPGTSTGYWFGDADSYSSYGMLTKVSERRAIEFSSTSLNDQGTVTSAGLMTHEQFYDYPLSPADPGGSSLTDAPTYLSMTERWTREGVNIDEAVTTYSSQPNASPRTITITLPNGTRNIQYSHNAPGSFLDGLVYQDQTLDANDNVLQSSSVTWVQGAYESPRPTRIEVTNELSQITATEFSYGSVFNQVTEIRNYDYGGATLLRATRTQYQNSADYISRHIFSLPLMVEVFAGDGVTRLSRTDYQYDGQPLTASPGVVQHDATFNPHAEAEGLCFLVPDGNDPDCTPACARELPTFCDDYSCCNGVCSEVLVCPYIPATDFRGNITQTTTYADALNLTGAVTKTRRYDVAGNLVTAGESCCEQTSFEYSVDTQYAYPLSRTRGSATDPLAQVKTSTTYDFNTGLLLSVTDANGRTSQSDYFADTIRPKTVSRSSGAHTDYAYDDATMSVMETAYLESHPTHTTIGEQNVKFLNGRGQVRQEKALGANGVWDFVDVKYDSMGQVSQQSRPYRTGDTLQWSTTAYDALSRPISLELPDGSITQTFYNETTRPAAASSTPGETMRVRDAWGRERWGRTDSQNRLVEVVEPDPSGSGSVSNPGALATTYTYDTLGNLIATNQGGQTRSFKYDSLGRLTAQKLAETSATLNDAGQYVGSGTWGDVFTYDERSNLVSRTDARGVKTVYNYNNDPLNRLQSVSWNMLGFGDIANPILAAATVTYQYRTKSTASQLRDITQLSSVATAGISTESYDYDAEDRISSKTLTLTSRSSFPFVTDYIYDNLDRIKDLRYPAEYGNGTQPRKVVHYSYDVASRLTSLSVDGAMHASNVVYNPDSRTTSIGVGIAGPNQIIESYNYDQQTGLLASQTLARSSTPTTKLLDLSYDYAGTNGKRTGQLVKVLNNLDHNKDRSYSYDALGRLVQAKGGATSSSPLWTQTYSYDRYGNRTTVSASGFSASMNKRDSGLTGTKDVESVIANNGAAPRPTSNSHHASRSTSITPSTQQGGPPVFTDPDLLAPGGVIIQALHITELRAAINDLRARRGMAAFSWQTSLAGLVKADPILEMRTALDQVLGPPPSPGYSPGLAVSQPILAVHIQELRNRVVANWTVSVAIPIDGHSNLAYASATNRITTAGFAYDAAGNQVRALVPGGGSQRFQYDAANRLVKVKADDNVTVIGSYTYGDSNERLIRDEGGLRTYFACGGSVEYSESGSSTTPQWSKSYVYFGARLLSTLTSNGSGGESVQYHHPDRLGTRLITNAQDTTNFEQVGLPFGTALTAESTGATNRRFTTYDRGATIGLDYALNRQYDSQQGRFTQVDPIGMRSTNLEDPQTLNLYAYCSNDPVNNVDPDGLGLFSGIGKIFKSVVKFVKKVIKVIKVVIAVVRAVQAVLAFIAAPNPITFLTAIAKITDAVSKVLDLLGHSKTSKIFGIVSAAASFGVSLLEADAKTNLKNILKAISDGASLTSKILTELGHEKLAQIFGLAAFITKSVSDNVDDKTGKINWKISTWAAFKFIRGTLEKIAKISGATRVAGFLETLGFPEEVVGAYEDVKSFINEPKTKSNSKGSFDGLEIVQGVVGNVNSSIGRVDTAIALAH